MEYPDASLFELVDVPFSLRQNNDTLAVEVLLERRTQSLGIPRAGTRFAIPLASEPIGEGADVPHQRLKFSRPLTRERPPKLERPPAPGEARCEQRDGRSAQREY